jgi:hypothetical protein
MISRSLPRSNGSRRTALRTGLKQHVNAGANTVLTNNTATRLTTIEPQYENAINQVLQSEALSADATNAKLKAQFECSIYTNHGLRTVMMAVERGEMPRAVLKLYSLDENGPVLPPLDTEQDVVSAAENFLNGEQARIAAGGAALPMPTAAQVQAKLDDFNKALDTQNTAQTDLKNKQKVLEDLNPEANAIIKKVWDEAETFYNEEADDTRRSYCRIWGVVYVSDTRISITGVVVHIVNNAAQAVENFTVKILENDDKTEGKANGLFELKTGLTGPATIVIESTGMQTVTIQQNIDGNSNINLGEITMVAV